MNSPRSTLYKSLGTTFFLLLTLLAHAQSDTVGIRTVLDRLFTGMRTGDSSLVSRSFTTDATLQSVSMAPDGKVRVEKATIAGFVMAVGTPHQEVWDERIHDLTIQVDGLMATVWAPYTFYLGGKFSHCGVNAFTLLKTKNGWKIAAITDTRRKEECR